MAEFIPGKGIVIGEDPKYEWLRDNVDWKKAVGIVLVAVEADGTFNLYTTGKLDFTTVGAVEASKIALIRDIWKATEAEENEQENDDDQDVQG